MFCPNCGSKLPDDARFCGSCGARLQTAQSAPKPVAPVMPDPVPVTPRPAPEPVKPKPKKEKKGGKKILPVILCVVLVLAIAAGAVAAWQLFFAKETVYLLVESTSYQKENSWKTSIHWDYDRDGNPLWYKRHIDYTGTLAGVDDSMVEIHYEYADEKIVAAEVSENNYAYRLEYSYKDGILAGIDVVDSNCISDLEVEIDPNGRIIGMEITRTAGEYSSVRSYEYDENGLLQNREIKWLESGAVSVTAFDENGNLTSATSYWEDELDGRRESEYTDTGMLLSTSYYSNTNELVYSIVCSPEYDKDGNLTEAELTLDYGMYVGSIVFEAEYDDLELTLTPVEVLGTFDGQSDLPKDTYITVLYDAAGNVLEICIYSAGEVYRKDTYEYRELKVPKGYQKITNINPYWFPINS